MRGPHKKARVAVGEGVMGSNSTARCRSTAGTPGPHRKDWRAVDAAGQGSDLVTTTGGNPISGRKRIRGWENGRAEGGEQETSEKMKMGGRKKMGGKEMRAKERGAKERGAKKSAKEGGGMTSDGRPKMERTRPESKRKLLSNAYAMVGESGVWRQAHVRKSGEMR